MKPPPMQLRNCQLFGCSSCHAADADAASDAARVTPGNAPATVALPETTNSVKAGGDAAYTKERKVSLLGLLRKLKSEEPAHA